MKLLHVKIKDDAKADTVQNLLSELPFVEVEGETLGQNLRQKILKHAGMLEDISEEEGELFNNSVDRKSLFDIRKVDDCFADGRLSGGKAAKLAGMSRIAFLCNAYRHNVDWLSYSKDEVRRELSEQ